MKIGKLKKPYVTEDSSHAKGRDSAADSDANLEPDACHEPVAANAVAPFDSLVRVSFIHTRKRLADSDGISGKAALDGLVACGLLKDDSASYVEEVSHRQRKGEREETLIVIEEVTNQPITGARG